MSLDYASSPERPDGADLPPEAAVTDAREADAGHIQARFMETLERPRSYRYRVYALTTLVMAAIFLCDIYIELGVAAGVPYLFPVWLVSKARQRWAIFLAGAMATALIVAGYLLSPEYGALWQVLANRALAFIAVWLMAFVALEFHHVATASTTVAQRELARLAGQTADAMISVGMDGTVKAWSAGAERIFGYQADEMVGSPIGRLMIEGQNDGLREVVRDVVAGKVIERWPAVRRHKDGRRIEVELTISPIRDSEDVVVGIVGVSRDVTARNQAIREAEALRGQLKATNDALMRSNQDLGEFVSIASHDLRAPMRGIRALVTFIEEDTENRISEDSEGYLASLVSRVCRLQATLDGLLQYARAGRGKAEVTRVDCTVLCNSIRDFLCLPATFEIDIAPDMPVIKTSCSALETVVRNLISNAVRHHDRNGGKIAVRARETRDEVEFSISDDGPGIDPMFHSRIFEAFKTASAREDSAGTGLGLAIVQRLVDAAGGRVWIESTEGRRGSNFRFTWRKTWPLVPDAEGPGGGG